LILQWLQWVIGIPVLIGFPVNDITPVVVPTTVPDVGLIHIPWSYSAGLFPFISDVSAFSAAVFLIVVLLAQTLQCSRPSSRSSHVLYSVSRSINLIPNPNCPVGRASYFHSRGGLPMRLSVWSCIVLKAGCWACLIPCLLYTAPWVSLHQ